MKSKEKITDSRRQSIADWVKGISIMMLFAAFIAGVLDVFLVTRGELSVPFWGYAVVIGAGVALQFVGAAIPNMNFASKKTKPEPPVKKPFVIK